MMIKYRLLSPGRKSTGNYCPKFFTRSVRFWAAILVLFCLTFFWLRLGELAKFRDLGESRANALNAELKQLPVVKESRDSWRTPRFKGARILSAYLDTRPEVVLEESSSLVQDDSAWAMIRIISIIPVNMESSPLTCHYRYVRKDKPNETYTLSRSSIVTRLAAFQENFGMSYCAAFILCELPGRHNDIDEILLPHSITVTTNDVNVTGDILHDDEFVAVRYPNNGWINSTTTRLKKQDRNSIAVCVQPLHHSFDRGLDIVAFVEFYRMMGVDRFTFYKDSVSSQVTKILEYYSSIGAVTIIDWKLPDFYVYERSLRVDGIFAALNDCVYRSSFHANYRYVAGVDVDEYIVPRIHKNFQEMMEYLNPKNDEENSRNGAWIFRNMFFYLMHPDDTSAVNLDMPRVKLHTKTMRWTTINPPRDRSKWIVQGRDVIDLGNHRVWKLKRTWSIFGTRYQEVVVDPEIAGSQHYRKCETNVEKCWQRPTTIDKTAHRFTPQLGHRIVNISRAVFPSSPTSFWNDQ